MVRGFVESVGGFRCRSGFYRYSRPERLRAAKGSACSPLMVRAGPKSCRRSLATYLRGWRRRHLVLGHVALALASLSRLKLNKLSAQAGLRGSVQDA